MIWNVKDEAVLRPCTSRLLGAFIFWIEVAFVSSVIVGQLHAQNPSRRQVAESSGRTSQIINPGEGNSMAVAANGYGRPSLRDGIVLSSTQESVMESRREKYRPRLRRLVANWQRATERGLVSNAAAIKDTIQKVSAEQRAEVLAVLAPDQLKRYRENQLRMSSLTVIPQSPSKH